MRPSKPALPFTGSPRTAGPQPRGIQKAALPSVAPHRRVDGPRPVIQAAGQILDVLEAVLLSQVLRDGRAAHTLVTVDDDLVAGIQLIGAQLDLLDRNVDRVLEATELRFPVLTDVEQHRAVVAIQ